MQQLIWTIFRASGRRRPGRWARTDHLDPRKKYRYSGEFGSLTLTRKFPTRPGHPEARLTENGGLVILFRGVWEFGVLFPGRPVRGTYPQVIHRLYTFREFGSLKALDTDLGPRAVLRTTRAPNQAPCRVVLGPSDQETV